LPPPLPSRQTSITASPTVSMYPMHPGDAPPMGPPPPNLASGISAQDRGMAYEGASNPALIPKSQRLRAIGMASQTAPRYDVVPEQHLPLRDAGVAEFTLPPPDGGLSPHRGEYTPPPRQNSTQPQATTVSGWGPFFAADASPTPVFSHLVNSIFTYLDKQSTGYLTPEVYSRFLINQGYVGQENACT
jgi:hypothetical protein